MKVYSLIPAGGGGTRFWPLSRNKMPKQFLSLGSGDIMINETVKRTDGVIDYNNVFIITSMAQYPMMNELVTDCLPRENILAEPVARNTAPCILYSALHIHETKGDGVICVFPSDHYIADRAAYLDVVLKAVELADLENVIVTLGIKPTYPATGYGYIKADMSKPVRAGYEISKFVEKPSVEKAEEYIESGDYFWNEGVFVCKASVLISLYKEYLPDMYDELSKISGKFGTDEGKDMLSNIYPALESVSIDYGIMEKIKTAAVVVGDYGWNDVGNWNELGALYPADDGGNIIKADYIGIESNDCIVYSNTKKLITTVGVSNVIIVDTGDALLVCNTDKAQDVKKIVDKLKEDGRGELL